MDYFATRQPWKAMQIARYFYREREGSVQGKRVSERNAFTTSHQVAKGHSIIVGRVAQRK